MSEHNDTVELLGYYYIPGIEEDSTENTREVQLIFEPLINTLANKYTF